MVPLTTQVRLSCIQAYEGVARIRAEDSPQIWHELLNEGRQGWEDPGSLAEAQDWIADTIEFLKTIGAQVMDGVDETSIELELPGGRIFDMSGVQYISDWAIPQFYFHVMTAYSILRHLGVDLGKADYVRHAVAYLRQEQGQVSP